MTNWIRKVDLLSLRLFVTVVEERSLVRAAARESMTASTATKRVQALEDSLGVQLLERNSRGLRLTPAGELVARNVRSALGNLEVLQRDLRGLIGPIAGSLGVAANPSSWVAFLASDVASFSRSHPTVALNLRDMTTPEVLRSVITQEVDVGVCPVSGPLPAEVHALPYRTDRLVAVMAPGHPAAESKSLTLHDLLAFDLIGWSPRGSLMRTLQQASESTGRPLKFRWRMGSVDSAKALIRAGMGVSVLPDSMVRPFEGETTLATVPISEEWADRRLQVVLSKSRPPSAAAAAFTEHLSCAIA